MRYLGVFSNQETLFGIERRLSEVFGEPYCESVFIETNGYLPIHESYEARIMQVLREFAGRYEIKRAVFSEPDKEGNVAMTWEKLGD
jgi:hypothetical protein